MASQDINFKTKVEPAVDAQVINSNTTTQGNVIDLNDGTNNFEALEIVLQTGLYTDGDYSLVLEDSDDNSVFGVVGAEDILGTNTVLSADDLTSHIGYVGKKQFVRVSVLSANVSTGATISALAIEMHPRSAPLG